MMVGLGTHWQFSNQRVEWKKLDRSLYQHKRCWFGDLPCCFFKFWQQGKGYPATHVPESTDQRLQPLTGFQALPFNRGYTLERLLLNRLWCTCTVLKVVWYLLNRLIIGQWVPGLKPLPYYFLFVCFLCPPGDILPCFLFWTPNRNGNHILERFQRNRGPHCFYTLSKCVALNRQSTGLLTGLIVIWVIYSL